MDNFSIFPLQHRGMNCLGIKLTKEDSRNALLRKIPHLKWSATHKCWYAPDIETTKDTLNAIFFAFHNEVTVVTEPNPVQEMSVQNPNTSVPFPNPEEKKALERFKQYMSVNRYAQSSIKNYVNALTEFLKYFHDTGWKDLTNEDIEKFQMDKVIAKNLSVSYQNTLISSIKAFYEAVVGRKVTPEFIGRPRRGKQLPRVISLEQVQSLLLSIENQKHRMMIAVIYACGLRSGELIKLKHSDILSDRLMIHIKGAKGNKDRLVPLSAKLLEKLRDYARIYKPKTWVFEGQVKGTQYSKRSIQMVFKRALKAIGFDIQLRLHDLRHSYATHQLEHGTNQRIIQNLLGHKSAKTTEIYTHVSSVVISKVYNPIDGFDL